MTQISAKEAFNTACDDFFELAHSGDAALDEIKAAHTDVHLAHEALIGANLDTEDWDQVTLDMIDVSDMFERSLRKLQNI